MATHEERAAIITAHFHGSLRVNEDSILMKFMNTAKRGQTLVEVPPHMLTSSAALGGPVAPSEPTGAGSASAGMPGCNMPASAGHMVPSHEAQLQLDSGLYQYQLNSAAHHHHQQHQHQHQQQPQQHHQVAHDHHASMRAAPISHMPKGRAVAAAAAAAAAAHAAPGHPGMPGHMARYAHAGVPHSVVAASPTTFHTRASSDVPAAPGAESEQQLYCICQQQDYGDMIACEAHDCPWQWFHYSCVGLTPGFTVQGKWYCPDCRREPDDHQHPATPDVRAARHAQRRNSRAYGRAWAAQPHHGVPVLM